MKKKLRNKIDVEKKFNIIFCGLNIGSLGDLEQLLQQEVFLVRVMKDRRFQDFRSPEIAESRIFFDMREAIQYAKTHSYIWEGHEKIPTIYKSRFKIIISEK